MPPALRANVVKVWGDPGRDWLAGLPHTLQTVAELWSLELTRSTYDLSFHWVAPATTQDGGPAVLKLGVPGEAHLEREAAALRAYDGYGAARLLARASDHGALLIERLRPGHNAAAMVPHADEDATSAVTEVLSRLHEASPDGVALPEVSALREDFQALLASPELPGPPRPLVERALGLLDELCADTARRCVVHGDLHHDNVLAASRTPWLAIDPHGHLGDPGYDVGAMLFNPRIGERDDQLLALVDARLEQLADELAMAPERVVAWGFVKAVLSEVWSAGEGWQPTRALDVAELLAQRLARPRRAPRPTPPRSELLVILSGDTDHQVRSRRGCAVGSGPCC